MTLCGRRTPFIQICSLPKYNCRWWFTLLKIGSKLPTRLVVRYVILFISNCLDDREVYCIQWKTSCCVCIVVCFFNVFCDFGSIIFKNYKQAGHEPHLLIKTIIWATIKSCKAIMWLCHSYDTLTDFSSVCYVLPTYLIHKNYRAKCWM